MHPELERMLGILGPDKQVLAWSQGREITSVPAKGEAKYQGIGKVKWGGSAGLRTSHKACVASPGVIA